jgi:N-acetylmuramoyl-L-alanine amidase
MILISAGHNAGAVGATFQGFSEYPNTAIWAFEIVKRLNAMCIPAKLVPSSTLGKKVQFINDFDVRGEAVWLAAEIHFNAGGGQGTETLYYPGSKKGKQYAEEVQRLLWPVFGKNRGVKEGWYKMDAPGVKEHPNDVEGDEFIDYFLRKTHCPALIIEPEFVEYFPSINANRDRGCDAIAEAI